MAYAEGVTIGRLVEVVRDGDLAQVRAMLSIRPELARMDTAEDDEHQALHWAVLARQPEMVRLLMQYGADPRKGIYPHRDATTALILATERGFDDIVAIIGDAERKSAGAVPNAPGEEGGPLLAAVTNDRPDTLAALLESGLDPDEPVRLEGLEEVVYSAAGPLHHCAGSGKLAMAEMLLAKGANPNLHVYAAGSPVFQAYQKRDAAMIALLERYGGVVDASTAGLLRLKEKARLLVEDNAEELLFYAADGGDPEIVAMALEHVDWAREDPRWQRMLMRTLGYREEPDRARYLTCFELILQRHEPGQGRSGRTMLHELAANWPHPPTSTPECLAMAEMLLNAGARMDVRDELLKSTPLGWACRWGRTELARLLLERGADLIEREAEPWATPRAWAEKMKHYGIVRLLERG